VLSAKGAGERIQDFVAYANQLAEQHDLAAERIPTTPTADSSSGVSAERPPGHIARLPGGRIALATQYRQGFRSLGWSCITGHSNYYDSRGGTRMSGAHPRGIYVPHDIAPPIAEPVPISSGACAQLLGGAR
jgi:hypothetical protein